MTVSLAAAEAALADGRRDDAIAAFEQVLAQDPDQTEQTYLTLARQLYGAGRLVEGERWAALGLERHGQNPDLWNIRGVFMRRLGRRTEALTALETAIAIEPGLVSAGVNRGGLLLEMNRLEAALDAFNGLMASDPANPLFMRLAGDALARLGRTEEAAVLLRRAMALNPGDAQAWIQLAEVLVASGQAAEGLAAVEEGLRREPDAVSLMKAKARLLRDSGQPALADAYLQDLTERFPGAGWVAFQQADLVWESDRPRGQRLFRRAVELDPSNLDHLIGLIQSLERTQGLSEGADLDAAYELALKVLDLEPVLPAHTKVLRDIFMRVAAFAALDRLGDFTTLGRGWAEAGLHTALLKQMGQVEGHADRVELLEQHRIWGQMAETVAARNPIRHPPRQPGTKIRLGVVSSDLRRHVVSFFAQPIFDHIDHDRFEVFAYSFARVQADAVQAQIAAKVAAFRWAPGMAARDAAQMIADDRLDFLVELGGSTSMNKLDLMAYKPAPLQASWLGYPHSTGLSTIDYFICDRNNQATSADLMSETPLLLPDSWVTFGSAFTEEHLIVEGLPQDRKGVLTFGTANSPQKYTRAGLQAWARIVAGTPGSRFAFVRPEAGSATFRRHVLAAFAAEGVGAERLVFHPVRGQHMDWYNQIDIALDTFPLTGGTTTAETLWMGVPVISLVGEAFYERISYSILTNAGLSDLCAADVDGYVAIALALAADPVRRRDLRGSLRTRIGASVLGQPAQFARNFYDAIATVCRSAHQNG